MLRLCDTKIPRNFIRAKGQDRSRGGGPCLGRAASAWRAHIYAAGVRIPSTCPCPSLPCAAATCKPTMQAPLTCTGGAVPFARSSKRRIRTAYKRRCIKRLRPVVRCADTAQRTPHSSRIDRPVDTLPPSCRPYHLQLAASADAAGRTHRYRDPTQLARTARISVKQQTQRPPAASRRADLSVP